jgi:hypothetical protein
MPNEDTVDTSDLLRRAWEAVKESGVPESMQEVAFSEAVADLRYGKGSKRPKSRSGHTQAKKVRTEISTKAAAPSEADSSEVDEAGFFAALSKESGVDEKDLRDVLSISGATVNVTPPSRELGSNTSEQAKTVIAIVAGARSFGLGERPVEAKAVRAELDRKRCYQPKKFAARHLGGLRGFNFGARPTEIVTTSKWVGEFTAAVHRALGGTTASDET